MEEFQERMDDIKGVAKSNAKQVEKCFKKGERLSFTDIAKRVDLENNQVSNALKRLKRQGKLKFDRLDTETRRYYHLP